MLLPVAEYAGMSALQVRFCWIVLELMVPPPVLRAAATFPPMLLPAAGAITVQLNRALVARDAHVATNGVGEVTIAARAAADLEEVTAGCAVRNARYSERSFTDVTTVLLGQVFRGSAEPRTNAADVCVATRSPPSRATQESELADGEPDVPLIASS